MLMAEHFAGLNMRVGNVLPVPGVFMERAREMTSSSRGREIFVNCAVEPPQ